MPRVRFVVCHVSI